MVLHNDEEPKTFVKGEKTTGSDEGKSNAKYQASSQSNYKPNQNNYSSSYTVTQPYKWTGKNDDLKSILALKSERYEQKVLYSTFTDDIKNYVSQNYKFAHDLIPIIDKFIDPKKDIEADVPKDLTDSEAKSEVSRWIRKTEVEVHMDRRASLVKNKMALYGLVWGQCTTAFQEVIKGETAFEERDMKYDIIWLLQKCKLITAGLDEKSNVYYTLVTSIKQTFNIFQRENESNDNYRTRFESEAMTLHLVGGKHVMSSPSILKRLYPKNITDENKSQEEHKMKAMVFTMGSDPTRYSLLLQTLEDGVLLGRDEYPTTITAAYDLLQSTCPSLSKSNRFMSRFRRNNNKFKAGNLSFAQIREKDLVPGTDGKTYDKINCHGCGDPGHYKNKCPKSKNIILTQFIMNQQEMQTINPNWILLDTCSTVSVFCNNDLVSNITLCPEGEELHIVTNGGSEQFNYTATANLLPLQVHFNSQSLANIFSLSDVANLPGARITMDTSLDKSIILHYDNAIFHFHECEDGLYYYDTSLNPSNTLLTDYSQKVSLVQSVSANKQSFTRRQIEGADKARSLQSAIGWPSITNFKHIVSNNLVRNCGITADDISRSVIIYGPPIPLLQGKSTRKTPCKPNIEVQKLPLQVKLKHVEFNLHIDFFYVNRLPFLHTKSEEINFLTVQSGRTRNSSSILHGLQTVINIYTKRGFRIKGIFGDNEFDIASVINGLRPIPFHIFAADEHCAVAERSIRTIKESCRTMCHSLLYKKFTKLMVYHLVETAIYWLNSFPSKGGASETVSPAGLVVGRNSPDYNNKYLPFGSYAWVQSRTTNTMKARKIPCISLGPTNEWGGHNFMSLYTGKRIHAYDWTELPVDDDVIERVEELAINEKQPDIINNMPLFEWKAGESILDNDDEEIEISQDFEDDYEHHEEISSQQEYEYPQNSNSTDVQIESDQEEITILDEHEPDDHSLSDLENTIPITQSNDLERAYEEMEMKLDNEISEIMNMSNEVRDIDPNELDAGSQDSTLLDEQRIPTATPVLEPDNPSTRRGTRRSNRTNAGTGVQRLLMDTKGKKYLSYNHSLLMKKKRLQRTKKSVILTMLKQKKHVVTNKQHMMNKVLQVVFAQQMSAKKGIKKYGKRAIAAILKEFTQLDKGAVPGKPVVEPVDATTLSYDVKKRALEAVNLIAEKRSGDIKGRTCADGSKQRRYLRADETVASPTVSLEALLCSLIIDAHEERDVAIFDVPGAYLHAEVPEDKMIHMKLRDDFVDIMCEVNDKYTPFIHYENGKKVLYLKVLRALYGCIESAMLWYNLFAKSLQTLGFEINPYDKCVANKYINGKQCTIVWYVDDVKVSHAEKTVVDGVIVNIEKYFGPMKVSREKTQDYLGMNITITDDKFLEIEMKAQIKDAINSFSDPIEGKVTSPTPRHLFEVNDLSPSLSETDADIFHSVTAKLLYLEKRARPDIETAVAFLTTRVTSPTIDDWKKLKRVLTYLANTIDDVRRIGCDSLSHIFTWIDAAFAVHPNMRGQTGGAMSFGWGIIHGRSSKQKINTKSSTESELVGVSEYLPYNIWLLNFMSAQGYIVKKNILYQDNESAIRMEKNGRNSCTGNSRHIDIRYFFVKDRVDKGEVTIQHCPTTRMLADYFTKPLQGKSFYVFRDVLMGWKHIDSLNQIKLSAAKERVENKGKNTNISNLVPSEISSPKLSLPKSNVPNPHKTVSWADVLRQDAQLKPPHKHIVTISNEQHCAH